MGGATAQYLVPISDAGTTNGDWFRSDSGVVDYYEPVGEDHADPSTGYDTDWIEAIFSVGGGIPFIFTDQPAKFGLDVFSGTLYPPESRRSHYLRIRLKRTWDSVDSDPGGTQGIHVTLLQGTTGIYSKFFPMTSTSPGTTWTDYEILIPTQASHLITDYDDLWLTLTPSWEGANSMNDWEMKLMVSHVELEVPLPGGMIDCTGFYDGSAPTSPRVATVIGAEGIESGESFGLQTVMPEGGIGVHGMDLSGSFGTAFVSDADQSIAVMGISWPRLPTGHRVYVFPNSEPLELVLRAQAIGNKILRAKTDPLLYNSLLE